MTTLRKMASFGSIVALFLIALVTTSSVCQGWWPEGWIGSGSFMGWFPQPSDLQTLPHYALFPPVYYSHAVPGTFGYTPFANLPALTTIQETRPVQPLTVSNPYVVSSKRSAVAEVPPQPRPLIVRNPFVNQATDASHDPGLLAGK